MGVPRFSVEGLPERLRAQVLTDYLPKSRCAPQMRSSRGVPNRCEAEYNRAVLHGVGRFEAVILRCPGGNYTPDWMTVDDGVVTFHEVKGAYRFGSESRAMLAFMSAAAAFPFWRFVWAQRRKDGTWSVKRVENDERQPQPTNKGRKGSVCENIAENIGKLQLEVDKVLQI